MVQNTGGQITIGNVWTCQCFCIGNSELRNNSQNVKLVWPVSHAHALSFFLFSSHGLFHSVQSFGQTIRTQFCLLRTKKETAARGENEGGRRASSDRRVRDGRPGQGGRFYPGISHILVRNFYVEIAFGHCQWNSVQGSTGQTDPFITVL